jgi:hypothetical protein
MKIIKTYESYNNLEDLDLGRFSEKINKSLLISNSDGTYDYKGSLYFQYMNIKSLTEIPIKLRKVIADFYCTSNELISLEGAPLEVGGDFHCDYNDLISFKGSPKKIGLDFWCNHNQIISFQYAPLEVGGDFYCTQNNLISLQYAPSTVGEDFICLKNKLVSLQYAPSKIGGRLNCWSNYLLSKKHSSAVKGNFDPDPNPFSVTDGVIETVKRMTHEQQMAELKFFDEHDKNASKMLQEILNDLGVDYGTHRKEMFNSVKDNKDLNTFF